MSYLIKIFISIYLFCHPIYSYSNNESKYTISHLIQSAELTLKRLNKNSDLKNFKDYLKNCKSIETTGELLTDFDREFIENTLNIFAVFGCLSKSILNIKIFWSFLFRQTYM